MSKFTIPQARWPRAFNQNITTPRTDVDSCVACTFTKIIEIINFVNTGIYTEYSKGYMYARNNYPGNKNGGMQETYTLNVLLERGTVPAEMCTDYGEYPEILKKIEAREDLCALDEKAKETKLSAWEDLTENNSKQRFENVKKYLKEKQMPLAVTIKNYRGRQHSVVAIGYEDNNIVWLDHDGTDKTHKLNYEKFNKAFYLEKKVEGDDMGYKVMDVNEFKNYINNLKITRKISRVQLHHTYSPAYKNFTGSNHETLQKNMRNYHVNSCGWADIGQHFTIFPDGKVCDGRNINTAPAGIYGANTGSICIECLGNFDKGGDTMTDAQKNAIAGVTKILLDRLGLNAKTGVVYHAWYGSGGSYLGTYIAGKSQKTCPGTAFFGGNTREAYEKNLMPLIENYGKEKTTVLKKVETINDIIWELANAGIITDSALWMKKCEEDKNVYWLCYKMANKLRGTL